MADECEFGQVRGGCLIESAKKKPSALSAAFASEIDRDDSSTAVPYMY